MRISRTRRHGNNWLRKQKHISRRRAASCRQVKAMPARNLPPAARAFDSIADHYDERFGDWLSVRAQRRAVRAELTRAFSPGARLLEIGGGTGDDALFMAEYGCDILMTDASPAMVHRAALKFAGRSNLRAQVLSAEDLSQLAMRSH